jgi:hypothetical protein
MGIDVLPPTYVAHNRHQEFKDVFEVSEELPDTITKERSHHFPRGLPSLKRSAMKLKKLMPSKSPYGDEMFDSDMDYRNGLDRLNSLEIDNPLFEKRPHDASYYPNRRHEKDTASSFRKYPVGLANSSLKDIKNSSRGDYRDFNDIVVLEPGFRNSNDPDNPFPTPFISHVNRSSKRDRKKKQAESVVMSNGRVSQHLLDTEDLNVPRMKGERYLTSDAINSLSTRQEASPSQGYGSSDINSSQNNKSSSNSLPWKIFRKYEEGDVGSRTLAQMFALSDSERVKRNSDSRAQIQHNRLDRGKGHSKEGCFIVLPKHAPPSSLHSSLDRRSPCESSPGSENFPNPSVSYDNGKVHFDSFLPKPRLNQITSERQALEQRRPASPSLDDSRSHSWRLDDNVSTSDCINERVLFTTDEGLIQESAKTAPSVFQLQFSREQKVCMSCAKNLVK